MGIYSYLQLDEAEKYKFRDNILHVTKHRPPRGGALRHMNYAY